MCCSPWCIRRTIRTAPSAWRVRTRSPTRSSSPRYGARESATRSWVSRAGRTCAPGCRRSRSDIRPTARTRSRNRSAPCTTRVTRAGRCGTRDRNTAAGNGRAALRRRSGATRLPHQIPYARHQPIHLRIRRIARAPRTDEAFRAGAHALDDRGRVEVAARHEHATRGKEARHLAAGQTVHRERDGGRAGRVRRWAVESHAGKRVEPVPEAREQRGATLVQRGERALQLRAARVAWSERREELDSRRRTHHPLVILRA